MNMFLKTGSYQGKLGMAQSVNTRNTQMLDLNTLYALLKEMSGPWGQMANKLQQNNVYGFEKEV